VAVVAVVAAGIEAAKQAKQKRAEHMLCPISFAVT
jgi:hypothetical protein